MHIDWEKKIKFMVFFIGYDWDVHNQIEFYISQFARLSKLRLVTIGVFCNGNNKYLDHTCEMLNRVDPRDHSKICKNCYNSKINKFHDVFDIKAKLFDENSSLIMGSREVLFEEFEVLSEVEKRNILSPALSIYRVSSSRELQETQSKLSYKNLALSYYQSHLESMVNWDQICDRYSLNAFNTLALMYNGRFHPYSGILSSLKQKNIDCILHERGTLPNNWRLAKNTVPYDALSLMQWIDKHFNDIDCTTIPQITNRNELINLRVFMDKRYHGGQQNFMDFTGTIKLESTIADMIENKHKKIIFYTSSLDEICIFDDTFTYSDQLKYLEELAVACNKQGFNLIVRQHPNLGQIGCPIEATYFLDNARKLCKNFNIKLIEPNIKCHWSILSKNASLSVVPYSSLFIDMMYHKNRCISLGKDAQLGKLTTHNNDWHQSIENLERTIKRLDKTLADPDQARRTKIFAHLYYLASCISIPMAAVEDNYSPGRWTLIDDSRKDQTKHYDAFMIRLLNMEDFPFDLISKD